MSDLHFTLPDLFPWRPFVVALLNLWMSVGGLWFVVWNLWVLVPGS